ncbi:MAG: uroporphyrinogen-III synthase, partial [Candidatus Polarisedimenticolia bacterium]
MDDLRGKTLLVTRAAEDAEEWACAIAARGGRALALPCLVAEEIGGAPLRDELRGALAGAAFLVFTSPRGVAATRALLDAAASDGAPRREATSAAPRRDATSDAPRPLPAPVAASIPPIACVGPATAAAARAAFGRADFVEARGRGAALAESLAAKLRRGQTVVVCAADRAQRHLEEALAPRGVDVRRLAVYRT